MPTPGWAGTFLGVNVPAEGKCSRLGTKRCLGVPTGVQAGTFQGSNVPAEGKSGRLAGNRLGREPPNRELPGATKKCKLNHLCRWAELPQRAPAAFGFAGGADVAAVEDEPVVSDCPLVLRYEFVEVFFNLQRGFPL